MCIPKFNNVSNFVFHAKKKKNKVSRNHIFFPILRNKTKLMMSVRFGISLWEIQMAVWVQLSKFSISLHKNEWPLGAVFRILYFAVRKINRRFV